MRVGKGWHCVAAGDYESDDGWRIYRLIDVNPPAWNVERPDGSLAVDGAATLRDAWLLSLDARTNQPQGD